MLCFYQENDVNVGDVEVSFMEDTDLQLDCSLSSIYSEYDISSEEPCMEIGSSLVKSHLTLGRSTCESITDSSLQDSDLKIPGERVCSFGHSLLEENEMTIGRSLLNDKAGLSERDCSIGHSLLEENEMTIGRSLLNDKAGLSERDCSIGHSLLEENEMSIGRSLLYDKAGLSERDCSIGHSLLEENEMTIGRSLLNDKAGLSERDCSIGHSLLEENEMTIGRSLLYDKAGLSERDCSIGHSLLEENEMTIGRSLLYDEAGLSDLSLTSFGADDSFDGSVCSQKIITSTPKKSTPQTVERVFATPKTGTVDKFMIGK